MGKSHIQYSHKLFQPDSESEKFDISFSTNNEDGMLIWKSQRDLVGNGDDLVLLQIKHGKVHLEYELGGGRLSLMISPINNNFLMASGPIELTLGQSVTDNLVHKVTISRDKTSINMSLDESFHTSKRITGPLKILNTVGDIFLGGGGLVDVATLTGGRAIRTFSGCVHSLGVSDTRVDLQLDHLASSNIINCQE